MKTNRFLFSQAIRFGDIRTNDRLQVYGKHLVRALEGRYGFVEVPLKAEDFVFEKGVSFLHGYFNGRVVIDKLRIYNNGIAVETTSKTDDCDEIIDDIISWAPGGLGLNFTENNNLPRMYGSHMEVEMADGFDLNIKGAPELSAMIMQAMGSYRDPGRAFRVGGFDLRIDPTENGPNSFRIERRANHSFHSNMYFCAAPLKTRDHIYILEKFENIITS